MVEDDVLCRIWAIEQDPRNGTAHWCHTGFHHLAGSAHPRRDIQKILDETPAQIKKMKWTLKACEPNLHDGSACKNCENNYAKGLSYCYDLNEQKRALQVSGYKGE